MMFRSESQGEKPAFLQMNQQGNDNDGKRHQNDDWKNCHHGQNHVLDGFWIGPILQNQR